MTCTELSHDPHMTYTVFELLLFQRVHFLAPLQVSSQPGDAVPGRTQLRGHQHDLALQVIVLLLHLLPLGQQLLELLREDGHRGEGVWGEGVGEEVWGEGVWGEEVWGEGVRGVGVCVWGGGVRGEGVWGKGACWR